eukprot:7385981-Prymnesium_polylepis.1
MLILRTAIWATVLVQRPWRRWLGGRPRPGIWTSGWGVRQSAGHRHFTGTRSKSKCRFEPPKVALHRHSGGTT